MTVQYGKVWSPRLIALAGRPYCTVRFANSISQAEIVQSVDTLVVESVSALMVNFLKAIYLTLCYIHTIRVLIDL